MHKTKAAEFAELARRFVLKGGTVVALSHANKKPSPDGKVIYAGTSDIVDDFDCAFTVAAIPSEDSRSRIVEFTNIKRRGDAAPRAAYRYSIEPGISYAELVASVQEMDPQELAPLKQLAELESDASLIEAIGSCIRDGINSKMMLTGEAAARVNTSKRTVLRVLEQYTGHDPAKHRWTFKVQAKGAKVYALLPDPTSPATD